MPPLFLFRLQRIGWGPPALSRAICFTQAPNSNVTPRILFNQISGHPTAHSSWPIKTITNPKEKKSRGCMHRYQNDYRILLIELRLKINTEKRWKEEHHSQYQRRVWKNIMGRVKPGWVKGPRTASELEPFHNQAELALLVTPQVQSRGHMAKPEGHS